MPGEVIVSEFQKVLSKKFRLPDRRIAESLAVFEGIDIVAKPKAPTKIEICDSSDRWIIATAIAGEADVLVTGDEDLLGIAEQSPVRILGPRGFWELLREVVADRQMTCISALAGRGVYI